MRRCVAFDVPRAPFLLVDVDDELTVARASSTDRAVVVHLPTEAPELTPRVAALLLRVLRKAALVQSTDEIPTGDTGEDLRSCRS